MPCFKPMTAWRGAPLPSGKRSVVFKAGESSPGLSAFPQKLPCGQCFGCRLDYSYDWAVRCTCEAQMYKRNCMILLTYENMPEYGSLQYGDWRRFVGRLYQVFGRVRYMHAGEYGTLNGRPHDHAILFGVDFADKKYLKMSPSGYRMYTSDLLRGMWDKGHATVCEFSFEAAAYVARYLMDKPTIYRRVYGDGGEPIGRKYTDRARKKYGELVDTETGELTLLKRPEYLTMSRRPGIGESWIRKYWSDVYPHDWFLMRSGSKMPPPRYFDDKVEEWKLVDMDKIKLHRMSRCSSKEEVWNKFLEKFQLLDVKRDDRLKVEEVVKRARLALYNSNRGELYE